MKVIAQEIGLYTLEFVTKIQQIMQMMYFRLFH